jgi:hypothetical protein
VITANLVQVGIFLNDRSETKSLATPIDNYENFVQLTVYDAANIKLSRGIHGIPSVGHVTLSKTNIAHAASVPLPNLH